MIRDNPLTSVEVTVKAAFLPLDHVQKLQQPQKDAIDDLRRCVILIFKKTPAKNRRLWRTGRDSKSRTKVNGNRDLPQKRLKPADWERPCRTQNSLFRPVLGPEQPLDVCCPNRFAHTERPNPASHLFLLHAGQRDNTWN